MEDKEVVLRAEKMIVDLAEHVKSFKEDTTILEDAITTSEEAKEYGIKKFDEAKAILIESTSIANKSEQLLSKTTKEVKAKYDEVNAKLDKKSKEIDMLSKEVKKNVKNISDDVSKVSTNLKATETSHSKEIKETKDNLDNQLIELRKKLMITWVASGIIIFIVLILAIVK